MQAVRGRRTNAPGFGRTHPRAAGVRRSERRGGHTTDLLQTAALTWSNAQSPAHQGYPCPRLRRDQPAALQGRPTARRQGRHQRPQQAPDRPPDRRPTAWGVCHRDLGGDQGSGAEAAL